MENRKVIMTIYLKQGEPEKVFGASDDDYQKLVDFMRKIISDDKSFIYTVIDKRTVLIPMKNVAKIVINANDD